MSSQISHRLLASGTHLEFPTTVPALSTHFGDAVRAEQVSFNWLPSEQNGWKPGQQVGSPVSQDGSLHTGSLGLFSQTSHLSIVSGAHSTLMLVTVPLGLVHLGCAVRVLQIFCGLRSSGQNKLKSLQHVGWPVAHDALQLVRPLELEEEDDELEEDELEEELEEDELEEELEEEELLEVQKSALGSIELMFLHTVVHWLFKIQHVGVPVFGGH